MKFKKGDKIMCTMDYSSAVPRYYDVVPNLVDTYTVREMNGNGMYLEEITNGPRDICGGAEPDFKCKNFVLVEDIDKQLDSQINDALKALHPDAKRFKDPSTKKVKGIEKDLSQFTIKNSEESKTCNCPACRGERGEKLNTSDLIALRLQYAKIDTMIKMGAFDDQGSETKEVFMEEMDRIKNILLNHGIKV